MLAGVSGAGKTQRKGSVVNELCRLLGDIRPEDLADLLNLLDGEDPADAMTLRQIALIKRLQAEASGTTERVPL
jgi:hypothetical protein